MAVKQFAVLTALTLLVIVQALPRRELLESYEQRQELFYYVSNDFQLNTINKLNKVSLTAIKDAANHGKWPLTRARVFLPVSHFLSFQAISDLSTKRAQILLTSAPGMCPARSCPPRFGYCTTTATPDSCWSAAASTCSTSRSIGCEKTARSASTGRPARSAS